MNLSKRLLLLKHMNNFIFEQYDLGQSTEDILGMLRYKSQKYRESESKPETTGVRKEYLINYVLLLNKRVIDFQYFRKKRDLSKLKDPELFKVINFRDQIIFKKIFND